MNCRTTRGQQSRPWVSGCRLLVAGLCLVLAGCTRAHYRRQADQETYGAVATSTADPRYALVDCTIEPDPTSRMYDPSSPDCEPMPPDDPDSHRLMHYVNGMRGSKRWHRFGDTPYVENPEWRRFLPLDENGVLVLDRRGAVEMALLQSPSFQQNLEQLYLSALAVTFQRFRFDTQFFSTNVLSFTADGPQRSPAGSQSVLDNENTLRAQKLFATGSELVVGLANSLVWQFSGPDQYTANTLLNFSLVQPLLRAAGRAVVLELLTDAERGMLANVRQMEQFRRGFYLQVVAGRNPGPGPTSQGIGTPSVTSPPGAVGGFLGLLEAQIRIRNQRYYVKELRRSVPEMELRFEAGFITDRFEVELVRQGLFSAESDLVQLESDYKNRLDAYKLTLGLPPNLEARASDNLLAPFDLISPELQVVEEAIRDLRLELQERSRPMPQDYRQRLAQTRAAMLAQLEAIPKDFQRLEQALPRRRHNLTMLSNREEVRGGTVEAGPYSVAALDRRVFGDKSQGVPGLKDEFNALVTTKLAPRLAELERLEKEAPEQPKVPPAEGKPGVDPYREALIDMLRGLFDDLSDLELLQVRIRLDTISWVPIDVTPEDAFRIAQQNRPDWMNARAALVDTWRQLEITANALESDLNLTFSGDMNTVGNNPVRFRSTTGRLRVGVEFDAPLTRVAERNAYRTAQINYQQARRTYYGFEDQVDQVLRSLLRNIRVTQLDFELRRVAVLLAAQQVDLTRRRVAAPPRIGVKEAAAGVNTGRNLVQALQGLNSAQNDLSSAWVDTETQRMNLDFDLGTMQLDDNGMWIDPGPIDASYGAQAAGPQGIEPPELIPPGDESRKKQSPEMIPAPEPRGASKT
jgi:outer membrane protein TolC